MKTHLLLLAFLMLALPVASFAQGNSDSAVSGSTKIVAADFVKKGDSKLSKGDYDGAIADYTKAIEIDPNSAGAYVNRGIAKLSNGNYDGGHVKQSDYPEQSKAELDNAIADFNKGIELNPKDARAYNYRAQAKHSNSDNDGAIADYTRAIEHNPKDNTAYFYRGVAKQDTGDLNGSKADFDKAKEIEHELQAGAK
jgi:tetratricopeptide (TPR) repeat protein